MKKYSTRYQRLVANTVLADPEDPQSCWLWTGPVGDNGYPRLSERVEGVKHPKQKAAHRSMLEEMLDATFPFDEGGHLCYTKLCINPAHLEVQTPAFNKSERRGYAPVDGCMIPTLFPREDAMQASVDRAWDNPGEVGDDCPF